jgi:hypothetical protein
MRVPMTQRMSPRVTSEQVELAVVEGLPGPGWGQLPRDAGVRAGWHSEARWGLQLVAMPQRWSLSLRSFTRRSGRNTPQVLQRGACEESTIMLDLAIPCYQTKDVPRQT